MRLKRQPYRVEWRAIALPAVFWFFWLWCPKHQKAARHELPSTSPSAAAPKVRKPRVAIILCKFLDKPNETRNPRFYKDYYTRRGTGGLADYWNDVTLGHLDLSDSEVMGWFTMKHYSSEVPKLVFPGGRNTLVQWGRDAAAANGVNLAKYDAVLIVQNWGIDHGAAGNGVVIVDQNVALLESTFIGKYVRPAALVWRERTAMHHRERRVLRRVGHHERDECLLVSRQFSG